MSSGALRTQPLATGLSARWRTHTAALSLLDWTLLVSLFATPLSKLFWRPLGTLELSLVLGALFCAQYLVYRIQSRNWTISRETAIASVLVLIITAEYLAGFLNTDSPAQRTQFWKAMVTWLVHASFMLCGAAYIIEKGRRHLRLCVEAFLAGFALSAGYGLLQLLVLIGLHMNLDAHVLTPLKFAAGGSRGIQYYGGNLYRINGLMKDTNHLGVALCVPIAICCACLRGRLRTWLTIFFIVAAALTLSRSGAVAIAAALVALAFPFRRYLISLRVVIAVVAIVACAIGFAIAFPTLWHQIVVSRLNPSGHGAQTHLELYSLIPGLLFNHTTFGNGLNSFALYFQNISGRSDFGPHSAYISMITETGMLGIAAFAAFAAYLLTITYRYRTPLLLGLGAALIGTWAGNVFYLTTNIMYVPALYALTIAAASLHAARVRSAHASTHSHSTSPVAGSNDV